MLEQPSVLALPLAWAPFGPSSFPAMPMALPDYHLQISTVHLKGAAEQAAWGGRECPLAPAAPSLSTMRHGVIHSPLKLFPLTLALQSFLQIMLPRIGNFRGMYLAFPVFLGSACFICLFNMFPCRWETVTIK